jgi:pSer/pThr/pTyr-binding forkhead associated (FHA) protein
MALTVIVLSTEGARLTFDGTQRVVIGRGAGSDIRLPEASVSLRHATLRSQGSDFVVVDEGSTNGTFVGSVRVAARTSRIVRSGDRLRIGRVWLELRVEQGAVTRDLAAATRDIALALVSRALDARGVDRTPKLQVVEGPDQGAELRLAEDGAPCVIGRGAHCALALADADVSREHVRVERRAGAAWVRDLGTKNGTWLGETAASSEQDVVWRSPQMMRIGRSVLVLLEPVTDTLAAIEGASDLALGPETIPSPSESDDHDRTGAPAPTVAGSVRPPADVDVASARSTPRAAHPQEIRERWSATDALVMGAALGVLALSLAGLVWLLRG